MLLLTEAGQVGDSASARDLDRVTAVGRLLGYDAYSIPPDFEECGTAENALWHIPSQHRETPAIGVGFIPTPDRYSAVYAAASAKDIRLVNDPRANQIAAEFDLIDGITPASIVLRSPAESSGVGQLLGYPLFLKGAVQSRKQDGWKMCLADDEPACASLVQKMMRFKDGNEAASARVSTFNSGPGRRLGWVSLSDESIGAFCVEQRCSNTAKSSTRRRSSAERGPKSSAVSQ